MPPSAGACQTTEASVKPDCGRAGDRSSIMQAMGCRAAAAGETSTPSSGATTSTGPGLRLGDGTPGEPAGDGDGEAVPAGAPPAGLAAGAGDEAALSGLEEDRALINPPMTIP